MAKIPHRPMDPSFSEGTQLEALDKDALDTPERMIAFMRQHGYLAEGNTTPTNIEALIKDNPKLSLSFEDLGDNDAYIVKEAKDHFKIVINKNQSPTRQRFSMAHEYAHYQLHRERISNKPEGEQILYRNSDRDSIEYDANKTASILLMPKNIFRIRVKYYDGSVKKIAQSFDVSPEAVRIRAENLSEE